MILGALRNLLLTRGKGGGGGGGVVLGLSEALEVHPAEAP